MDTSIALKPILQEEDAIKVIKILNLKNNFQLSVLVPDIFRYEFFNVMSGKYSASVCEKFYEHLTEKQWSIIPFDYDIIRIATRLKGKYQKITFYDAAYHALAKAYKTIFVTADERYARMVNDEDVVLLKDLEV